MNSILSLSPSPYHPCFARALRSELGDIYATSSNHHNYHYNNAAVNRAANIRVMHRLPTTTTKVGTSAMSISHLHICEYYTNL